MNMGQGLPEETKGMVEEKEDDSISEDYPTINDFTIIRILVLTVLLILSFAVFYGDDSLIVYKRITYHSYKLLSLMK